MLKWLKGFIHGIELSIVIVMGFSIAVLYEAIKTIKEDRKKPHYASYRR